MAKFGTFVSLVVLTAACKAPPEQRGAGAAQSANPTRRALQRLQDSFNSDNCGLIYTEASIDFRRLEPQDNWLRACGQLQRGLGSWLTFTPASEDSQKPWYGYLDGTAMFSKGTCHLRIIWRFESGAARLVSLSLQGAGQQVAAPESRYPFGPRMIDPPLFHRMRKS